MSRRLSPAAIGPLFLFVVLFGLSMDYHVFILSRIREVIDRGMSSDEVLRHGMTRTAGVVISAALVMVGVFSLFATASELELKQAGVGLAVPSSSMPRSSAASSSQPR